MNPIWFLRMTKWVRNPPSMGRIKLVFGVVAVCVLIVVLDRYGLWPDWAQGETRKLRWRPE
ncbi:hypothetical protein [Albirhodobacter sp. R86504]|jgi:hypothetical protein|uniref:hypothetical protein n=1 Tax=Albirhodobacter sp. R86504 TaxID=3093848 RepID=UPI0036733C45